MGSGPAARSNDELGPRASLPLGGASHPVQRAPFAWQDGRRLWILDGGSPEWILAELLFEPRSCRYVEVRRASYRWPREAAGALLGRTIASGERHAEAAARRLSEWVIRIETS